MVTYDLSKTTGDVADGRSNYNGPFTYNGGDGASDSNNLMVNLTKDTSNIAYTKYTHKPPKNTGKPSLKFNGDDISPGKYQPTEKLTSIDVYFLKYKGEKGKENDKGPGNGEQGENGKDGKIVAGVPKTAGQDTQQDECPFLIVFKESEKGPGSDPGSGETNKIYFGYPSASGNSPGSVDWNKWVPFKSGTYITDASALLEMKLKQIARVWNELSGLEKVRSTAHNIMEADDGQHKVKFKSGQINDFTVGYKQKINIGDYYNHIFATWRNGGSYLGPNCLLEVDASGVSKCSEPTDYEDSMKNKIDQYYIDQVKGTEYQVITAYFGKDASKTRSLKTNIKDNLLLVKFVDQKGQTKFLRRRDMNGNWWSLRNAGYVSEKHQDQLARKLASISSLSQDKQVIAFILDSKVQYKGVKEFKDDTSRTSYNIYSHNLNGPNMAHKTVLLFGGELIHIYKLKPTAVRPNTVQVYYLKNQCKSGGRPGEADDNHPFLVVVDSGSGNKRIYHLNDPSKSGGSEGSNDWSKWKPFIKTNKEQDVTTRLQNKLVQIERECSKLVNNQKDRRRRVYEILTHVDKDEKEEVVEETEDEEAGSDSAEPEETEQDDADKDEEENAHSTSDLDNTGYTGAAGPQGVQNDESSGGLGSGGLEPSLVPPGSGDNVLVLREVGARGSPPVTLSQEQMTTMPSGSAEPSSHDIDVQQGTGATDDRGGSGVAGPINPSGSEGSSGTKGGPGDSGPTGTEGVESVQKSPGHDSTMRSDSTEDSSPGPVGQDGAVISGASDSQCLIQSSGRQKRSAPSCSGGTGFGGGGSPVHPGSEGNTPNESGNTVVTIVTASGGTVAGVAALSGGGYLWHWMGTRTMRDMMVYF